MRKIVLGACATGLVLASAGIAQAEMSDNVIKIGVLNDRSGLYADISGEGSVVAARMAAAEFGNAIDGTPIEIVAADHQNKPDVGATIVRQWIDTEAVDVIADVPTSSVALAVQEVTRDKNRIFLIVGAASSRLTGDSCSPVGFHWMYDTYALAVGTGRAMVQEGGDTWFFITADYAFGHSLEQDTGNVVKEMGGQVLGAVRHPLSTADFSSYLLQAQASGAKVIGLANAGGDTINSIKQAAQFGIVQGGQKLAALLLFISDVHSLGLETAQGLTLTTGFYWNQSDEARAWSEKFMEQHGSMPTMVQAGVYSAVRHYLQAVKDAGSDETDAVVEKMRATPIHDAVIPDGTILANGSVVHDVFLAEVKSPEESKGEWDYYKILRTIPGDQAFLAVEDSGCAVGG
ncbi:MAG: ABC transporter substrate-binding protein [Geminicoccaceae bacterium]